MKAFRGQRCTSIQSLITQPLIMHTLKQKYHLLGLKENRITELAQ